MTDCNEDLLMTARSNVADKAGASTTLNLTLTPESARKIRPQRCYQHRAALTTTQGTCDMAKAELPTPEDLRKLISYDPDSGVLTWRFRPNARKCWNTKYAGREIGSLSRYGYLIFSIKPHTLFAHRAAWAVYYGKWPDGQIDHINHATTDNRLLNLRVVRPLENMRNRSSKSAGQSGVIGVNWYPDRRKWAARICVDYRTYHLGLFDTKDEAIAVRSARAIELGFHENHGRD